MTTADAETTDALRVAVLGAGPGGYPAAFLAAERGLDVTLIDTAPNPGGVCLYDGCIPSKALLHVARLIREADAASEWGVEFGPPQIDLDALRDWKDAAIRKLTGGLGLLRRQRRVRYTQGYGRLRNPAGLNVERAGEVTEIAFDALVLATGSSPAIPPPLRLDSERVMDSTAALQLPDIPESLLVVGGGYIGLELGSVYAALGSRVTVVELLPELLSGVDRELVAVLERRLRADFHAIQLETAVSSVEETADGIRAVLRGPDGAERSETYDRVLVATGRRPNSAGLGLEQTGALVDERGFIETDLQRRTAEPNIFAIGDVAGEPMLAHKASHEAAVAIDAICDQPAAFQPLAVPAVVFTDPEIAWCGLSEAEAAALDIDATSVSFPWTALGRASATDRSDGLTRLVIERGSERVLGMRIVGAGAGDLIGEGVLAVELGARASDLAESIHAHPTLSESLMEAAQLFFNQSPHYVARRR